MILAIDLDNTVVVQDGRAYEDVSTPLEFMPGALDALRALKRAGHVIVIYSARANRALRHHPSFDPLVRKGIRKVDWAEWGRSSEINTARYIQMVEFCRTELAGIVDAVDNGYQGKPSADLFIDDKALRFGYDAGWATIAQTYGEADGQEERQG